MIRRLALIALLAALPLAPPAAQPAPGPVTLINVFEVPAGALPEAIAAWEAARDFLAVQPGYISTRLHQALAPDARFALVNVALWESPAAFAAAMERMARDLPNTMPPGLRYTPGLYRVVRE